MKENKVRYDFNPNIMFPAYLQRKRLLEGITKYAPILNGVLLDFGCGSKPYRSLLKVDKYVGLDVADNPGHPHEGEDIDVFYDGKKIPFGDNYFDSVFSSEVFEHVFNLEDMLREINRVMKMDGKILVTCPFAIFEHECPNDYARYTSFAMKHLFEKYGFEVIYLDKVGNSLEVITQFITMYVYLNIPLWVRRVLILKYLSYGVVVFSSTVLNFFALVFGKILPDNKFNALYLNNVVLCKKVLSI